MDKQDLFVISGIIVVLIAGSLFVFLNRDKGPETFTFENKYEVIIASEEEYILKGFIGDNSINIRLREDPRDIKDIPSEDDIKKTLFPSNVIFITMHPALSSKAVIAAREISKITGHSSLFRTTTFGALTEDAGNGSPVKTCKDSTEDEKIIHLKLSNETRISSENTCITIEGITEDDLIRASDKLVLQLLEIL